MHRLLNNLKIQTPVQLYVKDPESSELGKRIVQHSIELIDELGFESFNFKKLGQQIGSPESTIYRYFENKHKLLLYISSWYWAWLEYKVVFAMANIPSAEKRLQNAIDTVTADVQRDENIGHIDEKKLQHIVISESSKAFLTKEVDLENKNGYFRSYKSLCQRFAELFLEINPQFEYAHTMASILLEGTHQQKFFGMHLPGLTDVAKNNQMLGSFFNDMALKMLCK